MSKHPKLKNVNDLVPCNVSILITYKMQVDMERECVLSLLTTIRRIDQNHST